MVYSDQVGVVFDILRIKILPEKPKMYLACGGDNYVTPYSEGNKAVFFSGKRIKEFVSAHNGPPSNSLTELHISTFDFIDVRAKLLAGQVLPNAEPLEVMNVMTDLLEIIDYTLPPKQKQKLYSLLDFLTFEYDYPK